MLIVSLALFLTYFVMEPVFVSAWEAGIDPLLNEQLDAETAFTRTLDPFRDFMAAALADTPAVPFRIPPGIRLVRVNAETGRLAGSGGSRVILEAFKPGTVPTGEQTVLDGGYNPAARDASRVVVPGGSDGLY